MKKILAFSLTYYPTFVSGAEIAIKEITDRISPSDISFHLITARFDTSLPKTEAIGNVTVHRVGFGKKGMGAADSYSLRWYITKILFVPFAALQGMQLHLTHRFDGTWAMMSYMLFPIVLMRLCGVRIPYALTLQEGDTFEQTFRSAHILPFLPLLKIGFRKATVIQSISNFLSEWPLRFGSVSPRVVIPNGVNVELFSKQISDEEIARTREHIGKREGETWLIHTGRFAHKNALDDVVRALPHLPANVHTFFIGEGPEKENLMSLAQKLSVAERVHFHPYVPIEELPMYLQACDVFIRPSRSEGMGNSFIEAMATGVPVIATQEGGIADFLFDAKKNPEKQATGFAVARDNPSDISGAVQYILANPDEVRKTVDHAREVVRVNYDWDNLALEMQEKIFTRLFVN